MTFIIILIVIVAIVVIAMKMADKAKAEQVEREKIEKQKKAEAEANDRKEKFEVITAAEKQKLSACGEDILATTLVAFDKAIKGNADAMLFMAITYQAKIQNAQKSAYWMQKASNSGNAEAMYWLGEFYVSGYGVPEDRYKGVSIIMDAAKEGNKTAIHALKEDGMSVADMRSIGIPV